jgi:two-component system, NtrC family, nitrogen regulation response regulator NtrX
MDIGVKESMQILIIDDEPEVGRTLACALAELGHRPLVATSGAEGLARMRDECPEAIFLDVRMAGLGGLDVLQEIRRDHPALPVVLITGHATDDELEEARRLGVAGIVAKPWVLNGLQGAINQLGQDVPAADRARPRRTGARSRASGVS